MATTAFSPVPTPFPIKKLIDQNLATVQRNYKLDSYLIP
jgi:hypothetical protein